MLGVSRQRIWQLARTDDFPAPVAVLEMGSVWLAEDVRAWSVRVGRTQEGPVQNP